jgi:hypothetical protein
VARPDWGARGRFAALVVAAGALCICGIAVAVLMPGRGSATVTETLPSTNPTAVPRPTCQPGDKPEAAPPLQLQGQVPWADRLSGRAAQGYSCNLAVVANWGNKASDPSDPSTGWANFDTYNNCAYYSDNDGDGGSGRGTIVLDVSDSANPVRTEYLTTPAMAGPWESLRVNAKRGLLVADNNGTRDLAIYDVSVDCRHPTLLFSGVMPTAVGHEGWFSPDGKTWWMSRLGTVVPVDISDPANPRELGNWPASHGGSSSDDGTRQYFCQSGNPDKLLTLDSSDIQFRLPNPQPRTISSFSIVDNSVCQQTYPVFYGTHPYVIQFGESAPGAPTGPCPHNPYTNYSHPRIIDMQDERNPVVISEILNEVELPSNCALSNEDTNETSNPALAIVYALFRYGTHQCTPDRLHDPTILACAEFASGLRVYDIRDPLNVKELAYLNPATQAVGDPTMDFAAARPVVFATKGEVWFAASQHGFYALRFANGVYPFPESVTCAPTYDYFFAQYNPETDCPGPTAVAVRSFGASRRGGTVRVSWRTASEVKIAGFNVYRKVGHGPLRKLNRTFVAAQGSAAGTTYRLVDRSVRRSQTYVYRLQVVNKAGVRSWYETAATVP